MYTHGVAQRECGGSEWLALCLVKQDRRALWAMNELDVLRGEGSSLHSLAELQAS